MSKSIKPELNILSDQQSRFFPLNQRNKALCPYPVSIYSALAPLKSKWKNKMILTSRSLELGFSYYEEESFSKKKIKLLWSDVIGKLRIYNIKNMHQLSFEIIDWKRLINGGLKMIEKTITKRFKHVRSLRIVFTNSYLLTMTELTNLISQISKHLRDIRRLIIIMEQPEPTEVLRFEKPRVHFCKSMRFLQEFKLLVHYSTYTSKNFIAFGQRIIKSMTNLKKFSIDLEDCEFLNNDTYEKLTRRILFCLRNLIEVEFVAQRNFQRNGVYIESLFENINIFSHKLRKLSIDFEINGINANENFLHNQPNKNLKNIKELSFSIKRSSNVNDNILMTILGTLLSKQNSLEVLEIDFSLLPYFTNQGARMTINFMSPYLHELQRLTLYFKYHNLLNENDLQTLINSLDYSFINLRTLTFDFTSCLNSRKYDYDLQQNIFYLLANKVNQALKYFNVFQKDQQPVLQEPRKIVQLENLEEFNINLFGCVDLDDAALKKISQCFLCKFGNLKRFDINLTSFQNITLNGVMSLIQDISLYFTELQEFSINISYGKISYKSFIKELCFVLPNGLLNNLRKLKLTCYRYYNNNSLEPKTIDEARSYMIINMKQLEMFEIIVDYERHGSTWMKEEDYEEYENYESGNEDEDEDDLLNL